MNRVRLSNETTRWIQNGIITTAQREQILALYSGDIPIYRKMSFWLQCAAATLVGLALFLVISENWQRMGWFAQSAITALPLLVAQGIAIWQERRGNVFAAEAAWFFTALALGANIMLQAQIFHISAYYPNGVLFWVIGILPIVWLRLSTVTFLLATILMTIYLNMQQTHAQFSYLSILPIIVFSVFAGVKQKPYTILPLFWVLYEFLDSTIVAARIDVRGVGYILALLLVGLTSLQQFAKLDDDWRRRLTYLFLALTGFFTLLLTFKFFASHGILNGHIWLPPALVLLALLGLFVRRRELTEPFLVALVATSITIVMVATIAERLSAHAVTSEHHYIVRTVANLVYFGACVALIFRGIHERSKALFLSSVVALLILALVRYADLFANYLVTALIFVISAVALVFLNKLWEKKYEK